MFNPTFEERHEIARVQQLINSLTAWKLEGSVGRQMMAYIEAGYCALAPEDTFDAYGNHIPSRTQVAAGSKGSLEYVEAHTSADHRHFIEMAPLVSAMYV